jgi:hypothetical protein
MIAQVIVRKSDHNLCWKTKHIGDVRYRGGGTIRGVMAPSPEYHLPTMLFKNLGKLSWDGSHAIARANRGHRGHGGAGPLAPVQG